MAVRADQHHLRYEKRRGLSSTSAFLDCSRPARSRPLGLARLLVFHHEVHPVHQHLVFLGKRPDDLAGLTLVLAGDDHHFVALLDPKLGLILAWFLFAWHYNTSGASEMIRMKLASRNS